MLIPDTTIASMIQWLGYFFLAPLDRPTLALIYEGWKLGLFTIATMGSGGGTVKFR